jgi:hypothetical protein
MDRLWIPVGFLILAGFVFYGLAGYCYKALANLYSTFAYYGVSENTFLNDAGSARLIFKLKTEIFLFIVLGTFAWMISVGCVVLLKRKRSSIK